MLRLHKLSLTRQILYLILMMLVILMISFIVSNTIAKRIIERKVTDSAGKILYQVEEKMVSFYSDMEDISNSMLYSPTIQNLLSTEDILSVILMDNEVRAVFSNTATLKENIRGIQLYNRDGTLAANIGTSTGEAVKLPVPQVEYSGLLTKPNSGELIPYYSISVPIYNLRSSPARDFKGTSMFIMDVNNFSHILKSAKLTSNSRLLLLDQNKKIMASEGIASVGDKFQMENFHNNSRYIVQKITLPQSGWELISIIPKKELLQDLNIVQRLNIATYVIMFGILALFLIIFFTRILKPIKALMDFMKAYPRMGGERRFHVVYHNEIGVLAVNLNKMLDEIDSLGDEIQLTQKRMYEMEIAKKQMEISAYRNQINPHFLYNTLECIRAMAFYYKVQDIADISASLSNMFRYSVKGSDFVSIQDEISHVQEYAQIIGFRFMGKIQVIIDADEEVLKLKTIKMLLQPIVENAVFHGLERKIDNGTVRVHVHKVSQSQVQYVIQDNGNGMEKNQLQELTERLMLFESEGQAAKNAKQGIGLTNIYWRIKLLYGDEADMHIESKAGSGTTVKIIFPLEDYAE